MKLVILISLGLSFLSMPVLAQEQADILDLCQQKSLPKDLVIFDNGFCAEYLKMESEIAIKQAVLELKQGVGPVKSGDCPEVTKTDKWKIRLYASHSYTTYFNTDVKFSSTRYNVEIKDYAWAERSSREFFEPKTWKIEGNNPFQLIDEPTNTFVMSIEKNGHEFFISAFHPKFLQDPNQEKYMKGTIDGVVVDGVQPVNKPFDGYNQTPGESELVRNQNTHKQMTFEIGYGHRFKLLDSKLGSISYVPSIGLGVMVGENYTVMVKEGAWWDFEEGKDQHRVQGFGGSLTNRIELNTPKERFGLFYENKLALYHQEHGFMDGTQKYNLSFMGNSVGMKFMIYNQNNHKKKL